MSRSEREFMDWYWNEASEQEKELYEKVENFGVLFWDMLFKNGTYPYELTKVSVQDQDGNGFIAGMCVAEELEGFDYSSFYYKVEDMSTMLLMDAGKDICIPWLCLRER